MVGTTLSTKNTTINREENKNNGGPIYSGVVGTQCSADHCFYFPHDL
jgi:hypothetical protein